MVHECFIGLGVRRTDALINNYWLYYDDILIPPGAPLGLLLVSIPDDGGKLDIGLATPPRRKLTH